MQQRTCAQSKKYRRRNVPFQKNRCNNQSFRLMKIIDSLRHSLRGRLSAPPKVLLSYMRQRMKQTDNVFYIREALALCEAPNNPWHAQTASLVHERSYPTG